MKKPGAGLPLLITAIACAYGAVRVAPLLADVVDQAWDRSFFLGSLAIGGMIGALPLLVPVFLGVYSVIAGLLERIGVIDLTVDEPSKWAQPSLRTARSETPSSGPGSD